MEKKKKREKDKERWARKHQQNSFISLLTRTKKKVREMKKKNENSSAFKTHLPLALRSRRRQKSVFASWQTRVVTWFYLTATRFSLSCVRACVFCLQKKRHKDRGGKKVKKWYRMTFWRMAGGKNKAAVCRVSVKLTLSEESRQKKKKTPFL